MTYVHNKALTLGQHSGPTLHPYLWKLPWALYGLQMNKSHCTQCAKNKPYESLKTGMIGGPSIIFCQYTEAGKSQIRNHQCQDTKTCASIVGLDVNSPCLYCSGQGMPCGWSNTSRLNALRVWRSYAITVMKGELFGFLQVDIHIPNYLKERFSEFCSLFIMDTIPEEAICRCMKSTRKGLGERQFGELESF